MVMSLGHFITSLLLLAFLNDCFECRVTISHEERIKIIMKKSVQICERRSTTNHEDDFAKVMSHTDDDSPNYFLYRALASQEQGEYYGVEATMDVYNLPEVGVNQSSCAVMCLWNKDGVNKSNSLLVGWHIYPEHYGDHYTHFFMAWEGRQQLCLNLGCQGFVLDKSSEIKPGNPIQQLPGQAAQNITMKISKDQSTGDWLLHYEQKPVGYWPKSLFTSLADSASLIGWGGVVVFPENEKSPPMGSGNFPSENKEKAASISNINLIAKNGELIAPKFSDSTEDDTNCYKVTTGDVILYGGPGGCKV